LASQIAGLCVPKGGEALIASADEVAMKIKDEGETLLMQ
jgi:hypothetical protein